jgi:murein L,D-transpeptidase YcbB/YkuD
VGVLNRAPLEGVTLDRRTFGFGAGVAALGWASQSVAQTATGAPVPAIVAPPPPVDPTGAMLKPSQWQLLQDTLLESHTHGLQPSDYLPDALRAMLSDRDVSVRAEGGRRLIAGFMRYARDVRTGRLREQDFPSIWVLRPPAFDPAPEFLAAVEADQLASWVASLPPPYTGYQGLRQALVSWRAAARPDADFGPIAAGPPLSADKPVDPRVGRLWHRLAALGYAVDVNAKGWDPALTAAVQLFQKRHGLTGDGVVAAATLEALNVPPSVRERQIVANLERWRWLPPTLPPDRVQVNIVAGLLTLLQDNQPVLSMRAVAGKPGNETPMLTSSMHSIVVNPPWNVPAGIAKNELFPKGRAYLARNGFKVLEGGRLQQAAGPQSALGRLKFDFANPFAVYLHDTPSQSTFSRDERLASHGCVRLQNPRALAAALLKDDPAWTADAINAAIDTGKTQRVQLPHQVAVYLLYWTAFAGSDGQVNFRADRYGWDERLLNLIAAAAGSQQA